MAIVIKCMENGQSGHDFELCSTHTPTTTSNPTLTSAITTSHSPHSPHHILPTHHITFSPLTTSHSPHSPHHILPTHHITFSPLTTSHSPHSPHYAFTMHPIGCLTLKACPHRTSNAHSMCIGCVHTGCALNRSGLNAIEPIRFARCLNPDPVRTGSASRT